METIIILANRGRLKAFRTVETPTRGTKLERIEDLAFPEAHGRFSEKVTDQAGRFPMTGISGPPQTTQQSTYEALPALAETERRLMRLVAEEITAVLDREKAEQWYFAASPDIHESVLDELDPALRQRLGKSVHADLVKVPTEELMSHFGPWPK